MTNETGIFGTKGLYELIRNLSADEHDELLSQLRSRTVMFNVLYDQGSPLEFVKAFYQLFDEVMQSEPKTRVNCRKGCHFCCRQNVEISNAEASVIVEYCRHNGIDISRKYLKQQLKYSRKELATSSVGWCTFLKDGECSIYPVRPVACRNYHVSSPVEMCDVIKYPPPHNKVRVEVFMLPELEVSAFYNTMRNKGKIGRLPEMLLPYSK